MTTIPNLSLAWQALFTDQSDHLALESGFIQRRRHLTGAAFLQALVFAQLAHPRPTYQQIHHYLI